MAGTLKIGSIPLLSVWHGEELTFKVTTKLGSGATFSKRATPRPAGEMKIDRTSGIFSYKPSAADREEITVWIRAHKGAEEEKQKVVITPHPRLNSDFRIIRHLADLPDPSDQTYVTISEEDAGRAVFNNTADYVNEEQAKVETKNVFVSGVRVVLESNSETHPLFTLLDDKTTLRRVTICADEVIVRSPLRLPGTDVFIYARRLAFEGQGKDSGSIDTSPRSVNIRAEKRDEGLKGQKAGDVRLFARNVDAPGATIRIRANGARGQAARLGLEGKPGDKIDEWNGEATTDTWWAGDETLNWKSDFKNLDGHKPVYAQIWEYYAPGVKGPWFYKFDRGTQKWPTDGGPPERQPGRPGQGGDGGAVQIGHVSWIEGRVEQKAGDVGEMAKDIPAAKPGEPVKSCHVRAEFKKYAVPSTDSRAEGDGILNRKIGLKFLEDKGRHWKLEVKPGPAAKAPEANPSTPRAKPGESYYIGGTDTSFWLHQSAARAIISYFHDAMLAGHGQASEVRELILYYRDAAEFAARANAGDLEWSALHAELAALIQRVDSPYDFYGNPAGWVPMLSFQTNLALFDAETDDALRTLFLAYWIEKTQNRQRKATETVKAAIEQLHKEARQAEKDYEAAITKITDLDAQRKAIVKDLTTLKDTVNDIEKDLKRMVENDLRREHLARGAVKILGGAMQLIPVGQPVLGAFGKATVALSDIDFDKPASVAPDVLKAFSGVAQDKLLPKVKKFFTDAKAAKDEVKKDAEQEKFDKAIAKKKFKEKVKTHLDEQKEAKNAVVEAFSGFAVKDSEVAERLVTVVAECPELKAHAKKVEELNARKAAYTQELLAALQTVDEASATILSGQLATIELRAERDQMLGKLSNGALQYAQGMGERARRRLLKYQYYLLKSYHYLMLSDPSGIDFRALKLFKSFADMLNKSDDGTLTDAQFKALKLAFRDQLKEAMVKIIDLYQGNAPSLTGEVELSLSPTQLETLNNSADNRLDIDLMELGRLDLREENIRITNIETEDVELASPPKDDAVTVNLSYLHDGTSRLRRRGQLFLFRSGDYSVGESAGAGNRGAGGQSAQKLWGTNVHHDGKKQTLKPMFTDPAAGSLLRYLVGDRDKETGLYFRPAAWSRLSIQLSTVPPSYDGSLSRLKLKVSYVSDKVDDALASVLVRMPDEAHPFIRCDATDVNGCADGQGTFLRTFAKTLTPAVTLGAPNGYGWRVIGKSQVIHNTHTVELDLKQRSAYLVEPFLMHETSVPTDEKGEPWPPCPVGWSFEDWLFVNRSRAQLTFSKLGTPPMYGIGNTAVVPVLNQPQGNNTMQLSFERVALKAGESAKISVCTNPHVPATTDKQMLFEWQAGGVRYYGYFNGKAEALDFWKINPDNNTPVQAPQVFEIDAEDRVITFHP